MSDNAWETAWLTALVAHLAEAIAPLLPAQREVLASGLTFSLVDRAGARPNTAVRTLPLEAPAEGAVLDARTVAYTLIDLQDEIVLYLGEPWPVSDSGVALHAKAAPSDDGRIELRFDGGGETIDLPAFRPPPPPRGVRRAG